MNVIVYSQGRSKHIPITQLSTHIAAILDRSPHADVRVTQEHS